MKVRIMFVLTKGDGTVPDFTLLPKRKQNTEYIKSCMTFMPALEDVEDIIEDWKIVDDGLSDMLFEHGVLEGTPKPIIEFALKKKVDKQKFLKGVWMSSYKLCIPKGNDEDPYFYEDHNGYSHFVK